MLLLVHYPASSNQMINQLVRPIKQDEKYQ